MKLPMHRMLLSATRRAPTKRQVKLQTRTAST